MPRSARPLSALSCLLLLGIIACTDGDPNRIRRPGEPDVTGVTADDQEMNAAIAKARETFPDFAARLADPKEGQTGFSVKVRLSKGETVEWVWLNDVQVSETHVEGRLGSKPLEDYGLQPGDLVKKERSLVGDWMYIDNGVLRGGFTVRVLRDRMSEKERAAFDRSVPFRIE